MILRSAQIFLGFEYILPNSPKKTLSGGSVVPEPTVDVFPHVLDELTANLGGWIAGGQGVYPHGTAKHLAHSTAVNKNS